MLGQHDPGSWQTMFWYLDISNIKLNWLTLKKKTSSQPLSAFVGPSLLVRYLHTMKQATDWLVITIYLFRGSGLHSSENVGQMLVEEAWDNLKAWAHPAEQLARRGEACRVHCRVHCRQQRINIQQRGIYFKESGHCSESRHCSMSLF